MSNLHETLLSLAAVAWMALPLLMSIDFVRIRAAERRKARKAHEAEVGPVTDAPDYFDGYFDKFGNPVREGDVINDDKHTYFVYYNDQCASIDAYAIEGTVLHGLTPQEVAKFQKVGVALEMTYEQYLKHRINSGTAYRLDPSKLS